MEVQNTQEATKAEQIVEQEVIKQMQGEEQVIATTTTASTTATTEVASTVNATNAGSVETPQAKEAVKEIGVVVGGTKVKQILPQVQKIKYPKCQKGNFHEGELLNYVQVNSASKEDVLGCAVCQEENKGNLWKPLKVVLQQALENTSKNANSEFNSDEILQYIDQIRIQTESSLDATFASFNEKFSQIKTTTLGFFDKIKDQILSFTSASSTVTDLFNTVYDFSEDVETLKASVHRLINFIPIHDDVEVESDLEKKAIRLAIENLNVEIQKTLTTSNKEIEDLLERQKKSLQEQIINAKLTEKKKDNYVFSTAFRHAQIQLVSPVIVKSNGTNESYRFAIIEPVLPTHKISKFAFKIKHAVPTKSWLALGVCHKNMVVQKNYGFQYSAIGHGGYMVSSNAGSWSTSVVASNNSVKSFSFGKNDTIIVEYDPLAKTIKFTNEKKPSQTYKLDFTPIENDPLYACVLLYYVGDEVEFIPKYTDSTSTTEPPPVPLNITPANNLFE